MSGIAPPDVGSLSALTCDRFLGGTLQICQPGKGLRAGTDAVLLAAAAPVASDFSGRVLDAGCGSGIAGLCLLARASRCQLTGLDVVADLVSLARYNAEANGFADRTRFVVADVGARASTHAGTGLDDGGFDHVICNPPFHAADRARLSPDELRRLASFLPDGGLDTWLRFLARVCAPGGSLTMICRADRLPELLSAMSGRFGDVVVFPIFPRAVAGATRILIQGIKGSRAPVTLAPGLCLHGSDSQFLPAAKALMMQPLPLDIARFRPGRRGG